MLSVNLSKVYPYIQRQHLAGVSNLPENDEKALLWARFWPKQVT